MKALNEIGAKKTIKFTIYSIIAIFYHLLIDHIFNFPQARKISLQLIGATIGRDTIIMNVKLFNWHQLGI